MTHSTAWFGVVEWGEDQAWHYFIVHPISEKLIEVDPDQHWFWTDEWQAGEREAEEDIRLGRYEDFDNIDDFFDLIEKSLEKIPSMDIEQQRIVGLRERIEQLYLDSPYPATGCGGSFEELLCHEIHGLDADASFDPTRPENWARQDLTFKQLAQKWGISLSDLGLLIWDHCCKLGDE